MNEQIDITVAIPVYNADIYIADTVRSVLEQDFTGTYEIIIIDDHGTDRSMEVVAELQHNHPRGGLIRVIRPEHNIGQGKGRAMALQQAKGRYFFMLDADDLIVPQTLSHLYDLQQKHDADVVWGSHAFGLEPSQCFVFEDAVLKDNRSVQTHWFNHHLYTIWNVLYRTNFLKTCQFVIDDAPMFGVEDVFLSLQVVQKAKRAVFSSRITYMYRRYQNSVSAQAVYKKVNPKEWDGWARLVEGYMRPMAWPADQKGEVVCQEKKIKRTAWQALTFIEAILCANNWRVSEESKPYIKRLKVFPIPGHSFLVMKGIFALPSYHLTAMMLYGLYHLPMWALVRYLKRRYKKLSAFAAYDGSRPDWAQTMLACYSQDRR